MIKNRFFAVPNNDGSWLVGSAEAKASAQRLAAPIVARLVGSGIVYHAIDENHAWLMACSDGSDVGISNSCLTDLQCSFTSDGIDWNSFCELFCIYRSMAINALAP
jgi:hypothetical protein